MTDNNFFAGKPCQIRNNGRVCQALENDNNFVQNQDTEKSEKNPGKRRENIRAKKGLTTLTEDD